MKEIKPNEKNMKILEDTRSFIIGYLDEDTCVNFDLPYYYARANFGQIDYGVLYFCKNLFPAFEYVIEQIEANPEYRAKHSYRYENMEKFKKLDVKQVYHDLQEHVKSLGWDSIKIQVDIPRKKLKEYDYLVLLKALFFITEDMAKILNIPCIYTAQLDTYIIEKEARKSNDVLITSLKSAGYTIQNLIIAVEAVLNMADKSKLEFENFNLYEHFEILKDKLYEISIRDYLGS